MCCYCCFVNCVVIVVNCGDIIVNCVVIVVNCGDIIVNCVVIVVNCGDIIVNCVDIVVNLWFLLLILMFLLIMLFYVLLPASVNPIAVNKYININFDITYRCTRSNVEFRAAGYFTVLYFGFP